MTEEQLRAKNLYYYSLISEYIDALDRWIAAPKDSEEKKRCRKECQRIEPVLRRERDIYKGKVKRVNIFPIDTQTQLDF